MLCIWFISDLVQIVQQIHVSTLWHEDIELKSRVAAHKRRGLKVLPAGICPCRNSSTTLQTDAVPQNTDEIAQPASTVATGYRHVHSRTARYGCGAKLPLHAILPRPMCSVVSAANPRRLLLLLLLLLQRSSS